MPTRSIVVTFYQIVVIYSRLDRRIDATAKSTRARNTSATDIGTSSGGLPPPVRATWTTGVGVADMAKTALADTPASHVFLTP
jgi:hypothetical protein